MSERLRAFLVMSAVLLAVAGRAPAAGTAEAPGSGAVKEPVKLTLWCEYEPPTVDVLNQQLKKLLPSISVTAVRRTELSEAMKQFGSDANSAPDLFAYAHDKLGLWVTMGIIEPLDRYFPAEKQKDFLPMTLEAARYNGKIYAMPLYYETLLFMYNRKLLDSPPKTTDELLALMKERRKDGNYGFVEMYTSSYFAAPWFNAFGGVMIDEKSGPGLNGKGFVDALTYHAAFLPYLDSGGDWTTSTTLFLEGNAAATINGPWFVGNIAGAGISLGVAPLPIVSPINKPLAPFAGVQGIHLVKAGRNKEAAIEVIRFLQQPDVGEALGEVLGCAPAHRKAYENETIKHNAIIPVLRAVADSAIPMPKLPAMDIMWAATDTALLNITKKGGDIAAELDKAQAWATSKIAEMGQ